MREPKASVQNKERGLQFYFWSIPDEGNGARYYPTQYATVNAFVASLKKRRDGYTSSFRAVGFFFRGSSAFQIAIFIGVVLIDACFL